MSVETSTTSRPRGLRLLLLGLLATVLVAGCGSADDAPAAEPRGESVKEGGPQLIRVHYTRPLEAESESYGVEMDVIARGADQSRTKLVWLVEDRRVEMTVLIIRDGNRALLYDAEAETPYTLMEAANEHPEDLPWESSPLDPGSDDFQEACPDADQSGTRTILGRDAVGYACTWNDADEGMDQPEKMWLDEATGMLLEYGSMKATEFVVDPEIDEKTFSAEPPAGADVHLVKATGKGPPPPDQGEDEPNPEDALATIASTSPAPVYYLGPEFEGTALSEVAIFDDVSGSEVEGDLSIDDGQSLVIWYGEDFEMSTTQFIPDHYRNSEGCSRLHPLRGVPTVEQAEAVSLISADLVIWLGVGNPEQAAPAAAALVEVGKEPTDADLPAPPARNVALIDKACGAKPGDHGRPNED
jgi:outer membrane lipoprotein-sorting protein